MKLPSIVLLTAVTLMGSVTAQDTPETLDLMPAEVKPVERVQLFNSLEESSQSDSQSSVERRKISAAELRQARALYESEQRIRRIEANKWFGHEPLRPNWMMVPTMTSRYQSRRTFYVPVYVR